MRFTVAAAIVASASSVAASDCSQDAWNNYYCSEIEHIVYKNVGNSGTYDRVSAMDTSSGTCSYASTSYSGSIAPLDEEVSLHIRGPVQLKNFAAYTPGTSSKKRSNIVASPHERRTGHAHGHQHFHNKKRSEEKKQEQKREVWVTATIDGQVVSWINNYNPGATTTTAAAAAAENVDAVTTTTSSAAATSAASSSSSSSSSSTDTSSGYSRVGYYDAESGTADGITFLGNYGGTGSGTWTSTFGNTLSYLSADGKTGADSSTVLSNVEVGTGYEYSIWTATECSGSDCGYYQDGSVAYHGFDGADKVFVFEFTMPLDESCSTTDTNCDMPAIWMLNSLIPRTAQYSSCSCWDTGCGEFDIYEILYPHDLRAKTTFHTNTPGGSSDYFARPTSDYIQVAVVFDSATNEVAVKTITDFEFPTSISRSDVETMLGTTDSGSSTTFTITS